MRRLHLLSLVVLGLALQPGAAQAATCDVTWDSGGDHSRWSDGANWTGDATPSASDNVCIPDVGSSTEVLIDGDASAKSITAVEPVRLDATLTLSGTARSTAATWIQRGVLRGPGGLDVSSSLTLSGGLQNGTDVVAKTGSTTTLDGGQIYDGAALHIAGSGAWTGSTMLDGVLDISGTVTMDSAQANTGQVYGGLLKVSGSLTRIGRQAESSSFSVEVQNTGTIASDAGTLYLSGSSTVTPSTGQFGKPGAGGTVQLSGRASLGAGSVLSDGSAVSGTLVRTGKVAVSGDVVLTGVTSGAGALEVSGTLHWGAGGFDGPGSLDVTATGKLLIDAVWGQSGQSVYLGTDTTLSNAGLLDWSGNPIYVYQRAQIINTGTFKANAPNGSMTVTDPGSTSPVIHNRATGTILRDANGDSVTNIYPDLENLGTIRAKAGRLRLYGGGPDLASTGKFGDATDAGQLELNAEFKLGQGATIAHADINGRLNLVGDVTTGANTWQAGSVVGSGKLTITADHHLTDYGSFSGSGAVNITAAGTLSFRMASCCTTDMGLARNVTSAGTISWLESWIPVADGVTIENTGTVIANSPNGRMARTGAGAMRPVLHNAAGGTITRPYDQDSETVIEIAVDNDGTITAPHGALRLRGGGGDGTSAGAFGKSTDAGWVDLSGGRFDLASGATMPGQVSLGTNGAVVNVNDTMTATGMVELWGTLGGAGRLDVTGTLRWYGGRMQGAGVTRVPAGGKLLIVQRGNACCWAAPELARTLRNEGTGTIDVPGLAFDTGAVFENAGTVTMTNSGGFSRLSPYGVSPKVINLGTFAHHRDTGGVTSISVPFLNDGLLRLDSGTLYVADFTQSAQGTLETKVAGVTPDAETPVLSTDTARLGGTITLTQAGSYRPALHDVLTPVRWNSRRGAFATISGFAAGTGLTQNYRSGQLDIEVSAVPQTAPATRSAVADFAPAVAQVVDAVPAPAPAIVTQATVVSTKLTLRARTTTTLSVRRIIGRRLAKGATVRLKGNRRGVRVVAHGRSLRIPAIAAGRTLRIRLVVRAGGVTTEYRVVLLGRRG